MDYPTDNNAPAAGRTYWASFEHLADSPEIAEALDKEFVNYDPAEMVSMPRRRFMKYVAASMALAGVGLGAGGCRRWPKEVIAPYASKPKDRVPGVPEFYATSWELAGVGVGLIASSFDGRPIKIEGNPQHPGSVTRSGQWGSADVTAQAQPLCLYDPDRSRSVIDRVGGQARTVDWFKENVGPQLQAVAKGRMAVLCGATASPTVLRLRSMLEKQFGGDVWHTWEPLRATEQVDATTAAFGRAMRPIYKLENAAVVVSLDDDYLGLHPAHTQYAVDWSKRRASVDPLGEDYGAAGGPVSMSKCFTAETRYSITGASGDYRLPVAPSELATVATAMAAALGVGDGSSGTLSDKAKAFVDAAVKEIRANNGKSLICFAAHLPADVQALAMRINDKIGAVGKTIEYVEDPVPAAGTIKELTDKLNANGVDALLVLGGNPVYDAPADLDFPRALRKAKTSVHLSQYDDETSALCAYHVPQAHFLEAWGDTRGWDGTVAPIQPLILPLFNGLSAVDALGLVLGLEQDGYALVSETLLPMLGRGAGIKDLRRVLCNGVVPGTALPPQTVGPAKAVPAKAVQAKAVQAKAVQAKAVQAKAVQAKARPEPGKGQIQVNFAGDGLLYDGRFANNGWLQETPETMTKLTWDNAALMSIFDAEALGVKTMDVVEMTVQGRKLGIAVYVMPGQPKGVVTLPLGYGRTRAGAVGTFQDGEGGGFDTYRLRGTDGLWTAVADVRKLDGEKYLLAMTQNHHLMDKVGYEGREKRVGDKGKTSKIIRETSFAEHLDYVQKHEGGGGESHNGFTHSYPGNAGQHGGVSLQIFQPPAPLSTKQDEITNTPHAWGMTIDMNLCIGCAACVVACQSENNIPIVGKRMVLNNREMQWLRVDRYFKADGDDYQKQIHDDNPDVALQPMMCQQCENAPCEQVCPVAATVHDTEGLNVMVYNRCIGTRYCSNNCPYKVRRFNFLDWQVKDPRGSMLTAVYPGLPDQQQGEIDAIKRMVFNPEVTVRMRGVMEKCTYCSQRIKLKSLWRRNRHSEQYPNGEPVRDGDIKTACQMACPTEAIVFGNLKDQAARVTKQQRLPRAYGVLDELNTRPRTKYLAKLRNREVAFRGTGDHEDAGRETQATPATPARQAAGAHNG